MSIDQIKTTPIKNLQNTNFKKRTRKTISKSEQKISSKKGLRVLIITQGMSRIVMPLLSSHHHIVGLLESASRNYKKQPNWLKLIGVVFYFFVKNKHQQCSLKKKAKQLGLSYRFMGSSDDPGLVEWVSGLKPDIIVIFSMSQLLKEKIFSIPKYGTINLHPSILPEYRGPNPDFWQYYNMEMNPGVTVHYIDEGEDTGDIIFQERVSISLGIKSPTRELTSCQI